MITLDENHVYHDGAGVQIPGVTNIIKDAGLMGDTSFYDDYSRDRGAAVHLATALYDRNDLVEYSLDPVIVPYLDGWKKFRHESGLKVDAAEMIVASELGYAGTLDRTGEIDGRRVLLDIKTGAVQPWTAIQTAAYERCLDYAASLRLAVELHADGTYKTFEYQDTTDWQVFCGALAIHNWKKNKGIK